MDPMVFQFIGETVKNATDAFVTPTATNLMTALQLLTLTGVTLYVTLTGYAIATGAVESSFWTFVKQCIKIAIIAVFALTVDGYVDGIMKAFEGMEAGLSEAMTMGGTPAPTIYQALDTSLGKGIAIVEQCFQKADEAGFNVGSALGWACAGLTVLVGTILVMMIGGAVVISAKFAVAAMFAIGPLFVMSLMFPITAKFFDGWFGQVMNYTLTVVIVAIFLSFAMTAYDTFVAGADFTGSGDSNPMFAAMQIGALTGVLLWILKDVGGMASGLAGGMSMAAMGIRHLMMPVTGGLNATKSVGNMINPMTTRRDMQSGMMVTARRGNHLIAGNTMWNPAYRQHVAQNMGKNWGRASGGSIKQ